MFLHIFQPTERRAFLALAHHVAAADGTIAAAEGALLASFRRELGEAVSPEAVGAMSIAEALDCFSSPYSQRAALLELMAVALADGVARPTEHEILGQARQAFGLDEATFERCYDWVRRLTALYDEAEALLDSPMLAG